MSDGRVFRKVDDRWVPIGDPLPVWDHVPPRPSQAINVWVLPKGEGYTTGDVVAFGETGHRLLSLVPNDDASWGEVIEAALAMNPPAAVNDWASKIELWLGMRLQGSWR